MPGALCFVTPDMVAMLWLIEDWRALQCSVSSSVSWAEAKSQVKVFRKFMTPNQRLFASVRHRSSVASPTSIPLYATTANSNVADTTSDAPIRNCNEGTWRSMIDENAVLTVHSVRDAFDTLHALTYDGYTRCEALRDAVGSLHHSCYQQAADRLVQHDELRQRRVAIKETQLRDAGPIMRG